MEYVGRAPAPPNIRGRIRGRAQQNGPTEVPVGPYVLVEVAGIEPASFGEELGLLRVQPAWRFLSPGAHAGVSPTDSVAVGFPYRPRDRACRWSLLTMPDPGSETLPG